MKTLFTSFIIFLVFLSCKKDADVEPPVIQPKDTLGSGWKIITSSQIKEESLTDVYFTNNFVGFLTSDSGIYKSTDGGNSWQAVYKIKGLINISMLSEQSALFVANYQNTPKSVIISTHDGANSFDTIELNDPLIGDVFYIDLNTAYAIGRYFWKSTDGGVNWTSLYDFGNDPQYRTLYFTDENTGWALLPTGIRNTTDGGKHWQAQSTFMNFEFKTQSTGSIFFFRDGTGFIANSGAIAKTTNSGANWTKVFETSDGYHDLHFLNPSEGYMTDLGYIHKTINGGSTWTKEVVIPDKAIMEVHFTDSNHGWACGELGLILKYEK